MIQFANSFYNVLRTLFVDRKFNCQSELYHISCPLKIESFRVKPVVSEQKVQTLSIFFSFNSLGFSIDILAYILAFGHLSQVKPENVNFSHFELKHGTMW